MMDQSPDVQISFCLPVYNVKEYIDACIRSIYAQNLSCFEIICIDDGSTDGSFEELEGIAGNHKEITVLRNESNRGIGYTRNKAIKNSTGKYIWFVDADDLLVPDTAALYLDIAEKTRSDIVLGKCISFSESSEVLPTAVGTDHYKIVDFSDPDQFYSTERSGAVCFGVWVGIFRRDFLIENDVFSVRKSGHWKNLCFMWKPASKRAASRPLIIMGTITACAPHQRPMKKRA